MNQENRELPAEARRRNEHRRNETESIIYYSRKERKRFRFNGYASFSHTFSRSRFLPQTGFLLVIWAAALPVIMNPARGIATGGTAVGTIIKNANLYFFSWLALSANVFVAASLVQEHSGVNVRDIAKSAKNARWFGLAASSLVVMVSSIRVYQPYQCGPDTSPFCKRTKFAIAMGVLSFLYSSGLVYLLNKSLTLLAELIATSFLLVLWCFGVGFITFGSAPGATIGNLYFSTWISFILMVVIFAQCFRDFMGTVSLAKQQQSDNDDSGTDEEIPEPTSHVPELPPDEDI